MLLQESAVPRHAQRRTLDRAFYTGMALAATLSVFVGFARTYYLRPQFQTTPLPLYLHIHGAVFTAWMVLFVVQTSLVAARRNARRTSVERICRAHPSSLVLTSGEPRRDTAAVLAEAGGASPAADAG